MPRFDERAAQRDPTDWESRQLARAMLPLAALVEAERLLAEAREEELDAAFNGASARRGRAEEELARAQAWAVYVRASVSRRYGSDLGAAMIRAAPSLGHALFRDMAQRTEANIRAAERRFVETKGAADDAMGEFLGRAALDDEAEEEEEAALAAARRGGES